MELHFDSIFSYPEFFDKKLCNFCRLTILWNRENNLLGRERAENRSRTFMQNRIFTKKTVETED